jgi:hypothetical protein
MLVGVHERFERRIGLFPAGFDEAGVPFTRTDLGDLPITLPSGPRDALTDRIHPGWFVLSDGAAASASSTLDDQHRPEQACDEDIRTWWSARTGGDEEWLQLDLGKARVVRAVQVNLYEQDLEKQVASATLATDAHRWVVLASTDGVTWTTVVDRSMSARASPHAYVEFTGPVNARYLKLRNVRTPGGGKFAVSDLRAFGVADIPPPAAVEGIAAARDPADRRKVTLTWPPAAGATEYLIRYGIEHHKLYQHRLVRPREGTRVTLHGLNSAPGYHFRVDAINDAGVTMAHETASTP